MKTTEQFFSYLAQFFLEWEMLQAKFTVKIKTHFLFGNFFFENPAVYETMWENAVERDRPQMDNIIWRMRIASWIPKATNTHSQYVIFIASPLQQWLYFRVSMLRFTYIVCLVKATSSADCRNLKKEWRLFKR